MLKSMTGYGKASCVFAQKNINIEVRSVNSKQLDVNARMPGFYKEKELEIRNEINKFAERGKIDFYIIVEQTELEKPLQVNQSIVKDYFKQIKDIAVELNLPVSEQTLLSVLKLPEALKAEQKDLSDEEWAALLNCVREALTDFVKFRVQEGEALSKDIISRVELVLKNLSELADYEQGRIDRVRERIMKNLNEFIPAGSVDANRFEQEIVYFLEKLDVTEEKVRLKNHCSYFVSTMKNDDSPGRKLGFIAQEMGREINTIGSKANDSDMQKHVVMMKDELEKIKEQLMNVL
jgi:uncharacterized protein (TIGR00255 family)